MRHAKVSLSLRTRVRLSPAMNLFPFFPSLPSRSPLSPFDSLLPGFVFRFVSLTTKLSSFASSSPYMRRSVRPPRRAVDLLPLVSVYEMVCPSAKTTEPSVLYVYIQVGGVSEHLTSE